MRRRRADPDGPACRPSLATGPGLLAMLDLAGREEYQDFVPRLRLAAVSHATARRPRLATPSERAAGCLLVLVHLQRVDVFVALIIIGREIAISALREWMAQIGASKSVAVHMLGKVKTAVQMVALPFLLYDGLLWGQISTRLWGQVLIWVAAVLTVWSMVYYLQKAIPEIRARVKR